MQDRVCLRQRRAALEHHQGFGARRGGHYRMADRLGHIEVLVDHLFDVLVLPKCVRKFVEDFGPGDVVAERCDFLDTPSGWGVLHLGPSLTLVG